MRNFEREKINTPLLSASDSGAVFSAAVFVSFLISAVFSVAVNLLASSSGTPLEQYLAELQRGFGFNVLSYALSSVGLCVTLLGFSALKKINPIKPLNLKKPKAKYWLVALLLAVGMLFGFTGLNELFISLLEGFGYAKPDMTLPNDEWWQYLIWIVVAALLPALFEEGLFRGYMAEGLKKQGTAFTVIAVGLLFSVFHQNPQQTPYQFICGAAYFLLAIKCGSVLPCMAMHFFNNLAVLTSDFFNWQYSPALNVVLTVLGILCFLIAVAYLCFFDKQPSPSAEIDGKKNIKKRDLQEENPVKHTKKAFLIMAAVGIIICLLMWLTDLFTYTV